MCCYLHFYNMLVFLCSLFLEYTTLLLCFIFLEFAFLFSNKMYYLLYEFIYFICYLYLFIICDNKYPIRKKHSQRENNNINTIMQNVILICILNNFIELESLELQVYFDICLIHLLNNQAMLKQLCYQKK